MTEDIIKALGQAEYDRRRVRMVQQRSGIEVGDYVHSELVFAYGQRLAAIQNQTEDSLRRARDEALRLPDQTVDLKIKIWAETHDNRAVSEAVDPLYARFNLLTVVAETPATWRAHLLANPKDPALCGDPLLPDFSPPLTLCEFCARATWISPARKAPACAVIHEPIEEPVTFCTALVGTEEADEESDSDSEITPKEAAALAKLFKDD